MSFAASKTPSILECGRPVHQEAPAGWQSVRDLHQYEIEKGKPWQNYSETTFNIQKKMADWHLAKAESWEEIVRIHDQFLCDYNEQRHWAHQFRKDGRHSPAQVLGWVTRLRHRPEELQRAFFTVRFERVLDTLGYARIMRWRVYGEEELAKCEVAPWLGTESLTVEYAGQALSRYEVEYLSGTSGLRQVKCSILFETYLRSTAA